MSVLPRLPDAERGNPRSGGGEPSAGVEVTLYERKVKIGQISRPRDSSGKASPTNCYPHLRIGLRFERTSFHSASGKMDSAVGRSGDSGRFGN
jgi:hypothetical protein